MSPLIDDALVENAYRADEFLPPLLSSQHFSPMLIAFWVMRDLRRQKTIGERYLYLQRLGRNQDRIPLYPRVVAEAYLDLKTGKSWFGSWIYLKLERVDWLKSCYVFKFMAKGERREATLNGEENYK